MTKVTIETTNGNNFVMDSTGSIVETYGLIETARLKIRTQIIRTLDHALAKKDKEEQ
jgi:hypothetical protein